MENTIFDTLNKENEYLTTCIRLFKDKRYAETGQMLCEQIAQTAQKIKDIADKEAALLHTELGGFIASEIAQEKPLKSLMEGLNPNG